MNTIEGRPIVLEIKGRIPSKKNRFYRVVDKEYREWQRQTAQNLKFQLLSLSATTGGATSTTLPAEFWMPLLPADDCFPVISRLILTGHKVSKGNEGATITITKFLPDQK